MNRFLAVNPLLGELKRSEVRRGTGYKLTTREFVMQREDRSYHVLFDDILKITQHSDDEIPVRRKLAGNTFVSSNGMFPMYKIVAKRVRVFHQSGIHEHAPAALHTELSPDLMKQLLTFVRIIDMSSRGNHDEDSLA